MPLTLKTPEPRAALSTVRIESFTVGGINEGAAPVVTVELSKGFVDGDGNYQRVERSRSVVLDDDAALLARMSAPITDGSSLYEAIRAALYDLLIKTGKIGDGTVG